MDRLKIALGCVSWVALSAIAALIIFIYPLTLNSCPDQCTVQRTPDGCYLNKLNIREGQTDTKVDCCYYGSPVECWSYTLTFRGDQPSATYVTMSRFYAEYMTALDTNIWYFCGNALAGGGFCAATFFGFVLLGVYLLKRIDLIVKYPNISTKGSDLP